MTAGEPRYLHQGVDYLGFLEAQLRDLRGIATLACELIQNAEVKSLSGDWSTRNAAGMTNSQFDLAREMGEEFWLYVVERATSDDYCIYRIQNPANLVNQFLFDDGWHVLTESEGVMESLEV